VDVQGHRGRLVPERGLHGFDAAPVRYQGRGESVPQVVVARALRKPGADYCSSPRLAEAILRYRVAVGVRYEKAGLVLLRRRQCRHLAHRHGLLCDRELTTHEVDLGDVEPERLADP